MKATAGEVASVTMLLSGRNDLRDAAAAFVEDRAATDPLDLLSRYAGALSTLNQAMHDLIGDARLRDNPIPWSEIGQALGVSKQAAQQRYGKGA